MWKRKRYSSLGTWSKNWYSRTLTKIMIVDKYKIIANINRSLSVLVNILGRSWQVPGSIQTIIHDTFLPIWTIETVLRLS